MRTICVVEGGEQGGKNTGIQQEEQEKMGSNMGLGKREDGSKKEDLVKIWGRKG
jgi:hypothetical protein